MIRVAICDDEEVFRKEMYRCCQRYFDEEGVECVIKEYSTGRELIKKAMTPDILLLDVQMANGTGIDVKEYYKKNKFATKIIFISSYPEAMREAFGENVFGFLGKPIDYAEFSKRMREMLESLNVDTKFIVCNSHKGRQKVFFREIAYIKADKKYSKVYIDNGENYILEEKSISKYEAELDETFSRCHKGYIVNLAYVLSANENVELRGGMSIPIGKTLKKMFREKYEDYMFGRF